MDAARDAVRQTRANLDKAQDDLSKTTIYAPLTGRVIALNAKEGEVVVSGTMNNPASVIATIADLSEILAEVDVDETEIVDVQAGPGGGAQGRRPAGPRVHGQGGRGGSSGFNRAGQPDVTFFKVKILLDDPDEDLRARMSVRAEIRTAAHAAGPGGADPGGGGAPARRGEGGSPPARRTRSRSSSSSQDGKARQRPVTTGLSDETHVELTSGVKAGEQVVTGPYRTLRDLQDGDAVQISKTSEDEDARAGKDEGKRRETRRT